ncbi:MAG: cbb3-type cytochrome c oxidase subunit [Verrucomicrobiales bacterium]|nr:cbb3-type cytochrome c oxidase subunit [Verrucomicrobiales bacterium]
MKNENLPSDEPLAFHHEADGIRELDNLLPRWWVWLFYLTTIFAIGYMGYYHVLNAGDLQGVAYDKEFKKGEEIKSLAMAKFESSIGSEQPSNDKAILASGQVIFVNNCAPCHRPDGGGLVGPNLTDDYWIHGAKFEDNLKVIWNGVPEKGMITWNGLLKPDQIHAVASYIYTLRGTHPVNPKLPENQQPKETGPSIYE